MKRVEMDDLVTLVLVKWNLVDIVYCIGLLMKLIQNRESLEESRFLDETLIRCSEEREISLCCYVNEIFHNASLYLSSSPKEEEIQKEFSLMLRGVFLLLLVYDQRVQRFIMTHHKIHTRMLRSKPPGRTKTNQFMDRIVPLLNEFLSLSLSLSNLSLQCQSIWSHEFMLQRFQEPSYVYHENEENIPHIDHQQIWWTRVHRDYFLSLDTLDSLGF